MQGKWRFKKRVKKRDNRKGIRRHSNNKGRQQIKSGALVRQVEGMAKRLGIGRREKMLMNHYDWLDEHLDKFFVALDLEPQPGIIAAHGDKCSQYRDTWEKAGIPFEHGAAIYLLSYVSPFSQEVRNTDKKWVTPCDWVVDNYERFKLKLPYDRNYELKRYLAMDFKDSKDNTLNMMPIMHNKDVVYLQLCGWSINLKSDGTWHVQVTEGG
jgi:hypothetical protein